MTNSNHAQKALRTWLATQKLEGFLSVKPEDIQWLTGFTGSFGLVCIDDTQCTLWTDSRYITAAKKLEQTPGLHVQELKKNTSLDIQGSWAIDAESITLNQKDWLRKLCPDTTFRIRKHICRSLRRVKTQEEIQTIAQAQQHVDQTLFAFLKSILKEGVSEAGVAFHLEIALRKDGQYALSFDPIVAFGANSAIPHHHPGKTTLKKQDNILIDCGIKSEGYCTDMTRNIGFKGLPKGYEEKYALLLHAQEKTLKKIQVGASPKALDSFCRKQLGDDAQYFTHSLGHGVGLEIHELPTLSSKTLRVPGFPSQLQENEVVTCEPGLYYPGTFGIRIEDLVVINKGGPKILSQTQKDLLIL